MVFRNFLTHVRVQFAGYKIDGNRLKVPFGHMLPVYQRNFPLYDRVLPDIISKKGETVVFIDIGANIGDTLFSLIKVKNKISEYHAIDGSEFFFFYLKKNIGRLKNNIWISCHNLIVANSLNLSIVKNNNGTAKVQRDKYSHRDKTISLDSFVDAYIKDKKNVFIKVDVDGYDSDVLLGGMNFIKKWSPELFFECDYIPGEKKNYYDLFVILYELGYSFDLYDNFGELVVRNLKIDCMNSLFDYRDRQFCNKHRTIYYFDVHAYK
jgi:FkbM family methyltransferase